MTDEDHSGLENRRSDLKTGLQNSLFSILGVFQEYVHSYNTQQELNLVLQYVATCVRAFASLTPSLRCSNIT